MTSQVPSHLFLLMECFHTRIKDLAEILHINDSLISKWRNNKRLINPKSVYADLICQYYMELDQKNNFQKIKSLLSDDYMQIENFENARLPGLLKNWLTEIPEQLEDSVTTLDSNSYTTQISVYHFESGRKKAVLRMLEFLRSLPPNQEFFIFDCEENSWRKENSDFVEKREKITGEVIKRHHLQIIHTFDAKYTALKNLFKRDICLNLDNNVDTYYIPLQFVPQFLSDMLIIKDKAALICQYNESLSDHHYAEFHTDVRTLRYYQQFYNNLKSKSIPIYTKYHFSTHQEIMTFFIKRLCPEGDLYFVSPLPFPFNDDIHNLLNYEFDRKDFADIWESALEQGAVRHVYSINEIESFIQTLQIHTDPGAPALLKIFLEQMNALIDLAEKNADFEIALLPELPKSEGFNHVFLVKDNRYAFIYKYEALTDSFRALMSEDSTAVFVLFQFYESFWTNIPVIQQDKEWVIYKLKSILKAAL